MAVTPNGRFLYVCVGSSSSLPNKGTIDIFVLEPATGRPYPAPIATVSTGTLPQGIAIDPAGRFVYVASTDDKNVTIFSIDQATGSLSPAASPSIVVPAVAQGSPGNVVMHPSGRSLYVTNSDGSIATFSITPSTGALSNPRITNTVNGGRPFTPAINPTGSIMYVPVSQGHSIYVLSIAEKTGTLTPLGLPIILAGQEPTSIALNPAGAFAYVVDRQNSEMSMYSVASDGDLVPLFPATSNGVQQPYTQAMDPGGQFLYVNDEGSNSVSEYTIGTDGQLTLVATIPTGAGPLWITLAGKQ